MIKSERKCFSRPNEIREFPLGSFQYQLCGTLRVSMDDGTTFDCQAGDISLPRPGHDAWVPGNEPVVLVDFQGMLDYAGLNG